MQRSKTSLPIFVFSALAFSLLMLFASLSQVYADKFDNAVQKALREAPIASYSQKPGAALIRYQDGTCVQIIKDAGGNPLILRGY